MVTKNMQRVFPVTTITLLVLADNDQMDEVVETVEGVKLDRVKAKRFLEKQGYGEDFIIKSVEHSKVKCVMPVGEFIAHATKLPVNEQETINIELDEI